MAACARAPAPPPAPAFRLLRGHPPPHAATIEPVCAKQPPRAPPDKTHSPGRPPDRPAAQRGAGHPSAAPRFGPWGEGDKGKWGGGGGVERSTRRLEARSSRKGARGTRRPPPPRARPDFCRQPLPPTDRRGAVPAHNPQGVGQWRRPLPLGGRRRLPPPSRVAAEGPLTYPVWPSPPLHGLSGRGEREAAANKGAARRPASARWVRGQGRGRPPQRAACAARVSTTGTRTGACRAAEGAAGRGATGVAARWLLVGGEAAEGRGDGVGASEVRLAVSGRGARGRGGAVSHAVASRIRWWRRGCAS